MKRVVGIAGASSSDILDELLGLNCKNNSDCELVDVEVRCRKLKIPVCSASASARIYADKGVEY